MKTESVVFENEIQKLKEADPGLRKIIEQIGPCTLRPMRSYFMALAEAIVAQQLSVNASMTIFRRFRKLYRNPITRPLPNSAESSPASAGLHWSPP